MADAETNPGVPRREGKGFISSFGAGRKCTAPSCETVLSRYNDASYCWAHAAARRADR